MAVVVAVVVAADHVQETVIVAADQHYTVVVAADQQYTVAGYVAVVASVVAAAVLSEQRNAI